MLTANNYLQVVIILPLMYASVMLLIKPAILLEWTRIFVPYSQRSKYLRRYIRASEPQP